MTEFPLWRQSHHPLLLSQDLKLFRQACLHRGGWIDTSAQGSIDVDNPATGEVIGRVPRLGRAETRAAIDAAARAFPAWRQEDGEGARGRHAPVVRSDARQPGGPRAADDHGAGKPMAESRGEVAYAASFLEWFGEEASAFTGTPFPHLGQTSASS